MRTRMVATGELALVGDVEGIPPAFETMLATPEPGFQIAPSVETDEALEVLRTLMRRYNPGFEFDNLFGEDNRVQTEPHLDGGYPGRMAGIAVHENLEGLGIATLQLVKPNIADTASIGRKSFVGSCLNGPVDPGTKTVFSERIYDEATRAVILGATYHMFTPRDGGARRWRRYSSNQILGL